LVRHRRRDANIEVDQSGRLLDDVDLHQQPDRLRDLLLGGGDLVSPTAGARGDGRRTQQHDDSAQQVRVVDLGSNVITMRRNPSTLIDRPAF